RADATPRRCRLESSRQRGGERRRDGACRAYLARRLDGEDRAPSRGRPAARRRAHEGSGRKARTLRGRSRDGEPPGREDLRPGLRNLIRTGRSGYVTRIFEDIAATVGTTRLVRLSRAGKGLAAELVAKVESKNPGGSVKDRIGLAMIEDAERSGRLAPGAT